ncbi:DUF1707 SHOCT-like domain-containing protein [Pseudonocardia sp. CA-107938]|uniref:DUF1707 SHOCT-like domain-containing protein n=1 Tax=Pseudonocardia sp. CA-107938 TaxID=3240021 RepID=UPI003D8B4C42
MSLDAPDRAPVRAAVTDEDRSRVAELLQRACGDGRIGLDEFTTRVGDVWEAQTELELARAAAGITPSRARLINWSPAAWLRSLTAFGTSIVDVRHAAPEGVVEVTGTCVFGDVRLTVPAGVAVEVRGISLFGTQEVAVAPAPRFPDTPVVRVAVHLLFGSLRITQRTAEPARD